MFTGTRCDRGGNLRERAVLDDGVPVDEFYVVVRAEPEGVGHPLRRRVHPTALVPRERALLVVASGDVLPQFRTDRLQQIPSVPDDGEVPAHGMTPLQQVVRGDRSQRGGRNSEAFRPRLEATVLCRPALSRVACSTVRGEDVAVPLGQNTPEGGAPSLSRPHHGILIVQATRWCVGQAWCPVRR